MNFDNLFVDLDDYEIGKKIANGVFSVVFKATNKKKDKKLQLKYF